MTAFYTFRLLFLAFCGSPRMSKEVAHHVHESPRVMTVPLVVLAVLTSWPASRSGCRFGRHAASRSSSRRCSPPHEAAHSALVLLAARVVVVRRPGSRWPCTRYRLTPVTAGRGRASRARRCTRCCSTPTTSTRSTTALIVRPLFALSGFLARVFDLGVIDGIVNGVGRARGGVGARACAGCRPATSSTTRSPCWPAPSSGRASCCVR